MSLLSYLLPLLIIASPLIFAFAIYCVRRTLRRHAQAKLQQPETKEPRRTYFYPTRELDGNGTDYQGRI